jgi:hypothetical protein
MSLCAREIGVPAAAPAATAVVVVLSCAAITVLDLAGTVFAKEWAVRRAPGLLLIGLAVHAVLFGCTRSACGGCR